MSDYRCMHGKTMYGDCLGCRAITRSKPDYPARISALESQLKLADELADQSERMLKAFTGSWCIDWNEPEAAISAYRKSRESK